MGKRDKNGKGKVGARRVANEPLARREFPGRLLAWYADHKRNLPWRGTRDPYKILVSEVMLQQTQVDRVIPKYHEFLARYPTLRRLARAPVEEVVKHWYPLGYNIRPRHLHGIARETMARYGGKLPDSVEKLVAMKGIGRYTAGAIVSFAFRKKAPILDTNVMRVLYRIFVARGEMRSTPVRKKLWRLAEELIPLDQVYDFNQALMDFGAMVCTARKAACLICPMQAFCKSFPLA